MMKNPLFLILIVRKNRDYFLEDGTQSLFNENGNTDMRVSKVETTNPYNPISVSGKRNDIYPDVDKQKGNSYSK